MIALVTPLKERDRLRFCYTPYTLSLYRQSDYFIFFHAPQLIFALASFIGISYTIDGRDKREGKDKSSCLLVVSECGVSTTVSSIFIHVMARSSIFVSFFLIFESR